MLYRPLGMWGYWNDKEKLLSNKDTLNLSIEWINDHFLRYKFYKVGQDYGAQKIQVLHHEQNHLYYLIIGLNEIWRDLFVQC